MPRPPSHPVAQHGYTLTELLIGVSVLGVLAAIATPSLSAMLDRQRAVVAGHTLVAYLHLARTQTVTSRRSTVLCPSPDGRRCTRGTDWSSGLLVFMDPDGNGQPDLPTDIIRASTGPTARRVRMTGSAGRPSLRYLPDGRSSGSNLTISICNMDGALQSRVIVNNSGRVRSERGKPGQTCRT